MGDVLSFPRKLQQPPTIRAYGPFAVRVFQHGGLWYVTSRKNGGWCFTSYREALRTAGEIADGFGVGSIAEMGALQ